MMQGVYDEVKGSFLSRAISDNRVFLMGMRDYNSYSQLYTELKEKGLDEFGFSSERKEDFMYPYMYEFAMSVDKYDISEYTYLNANKQKAAAFMYTSPFEFPYTSVNKEDRVVLYGAGKVGESYYLQNIINKYCKIVLWVDRDLTNKPSEVKGVGCINDVIFDKLIIAVNSNNLKDEIRDSLVKIGVENKKIY